jgi:hypothetical protein
MPLALSGGMTEDELRHIRSVASTGDALDLLPGSGGVFSHGRLHVVICRDCGLMRLFANPGATDKLLDSEGWAPVP